MTPERVRFTSHRFPFYVEVTRCSRPDCECGEVTFHLDEGAHGEQLPSNPMRIRIRVDPETWQEVDAPQRPPAAAAIVQEFLRDYPAGQRAAYQRAARRTKEAARRLREYRIAPRVIRDGLLVAWGDIISDRPAGQADLASMLDCFKHEDALYLVDDLYCPNPNCRCREVHLLFMEYHAADKPGGSARGEDRFRARIFLDGALEIDGCIRGTIEEASAIAAAWRANFEKDLYELEWRYHKVKEIARRTKVPPPTAEEPRQFPVRSTPVAGRVGRNDPCPCGSGRKFKRCCGR